MAIPPIVEVWVSREGDDPEFLRIEDSHNRVPLEIDVSMACAMIDALQTILVHKRVKKIAVVSSAYRGD